ncbi:MAG TPA: peroxiredoxin [bacterium]|nr:peroxiredoxin [bacterium]
MNIGERLPAFCLPDQTGTKKSFKDLAGKNGLILYVYPKDNTSGCAKEAEEFNSLLDAFKKKSIGVVGISKDSVKSHQNFAEKYDLGFPLLTDTDLKLLKAIGAFGEKKMYGKPVMGTIRSTFVFNSKGEAVKIYANVKAAGHAENVLSDLDNKNKLTCKRNG